MKIFVEIYASGYSRSEHHYINPEKLELIWDMLNKPTQLQSILRLQVDLDSINH